MGQALQPEAEMCCPLLFGCDTRPEPQAPRCWGGAGGGEAVSARELVGGPSLRRVATLHFIDRTLRLWGVGGWGEWWSGFPKVPELGNDLSFPPLTSGGGV